MAGSAQATPFKILYAFNGKDGRFPTGAPLLADTAGNLFGLTADGGANDRGTIFKLARDGTETVLHSFGESGDLSSPTSNLVGDAKGNLYGASFVANKIFKLKPDGTESILYEGVNWPGNLVMDKKGNLYGEALFGGNLACDNGCGTIFRLTPNGKFSTIYSFAGGGDGRYPSGGLTIGSDGNFYGTTAGSSILGPRGHGNWGTIFKLSPHGAMTVLYVFAHRRDGAAPYWGVMKDAFGNLYGVAATGGHRWCGISRGCGEVFRLTEDGTLTVLHKFRGGDDGGWPNSRPVMDASGNLYGATSYGLGSIYRVSPTGRKRTLHMGGSEGIPGAVILLSDGNLYGTVRPDNRVTAGAVVKVSLAVQRDVKSAHR